MYGYTRFWKDGNIKWLEKSIEDRAPEENAPSFDNVLSITLVACDIKTDVPGVTWMVERNGDLLHHFSIPDTTSWDTYLNTITVSSQDELPLKLIFSSESEAIRADFRLYLIVNGANIVNCADDLSFKCSRVNQLTVIFS